MAVKMAETMSRDRGSLIDLNDRLDALWTSYLNHLHQYTAAQKLLQQHISAGFLSLARADFTASGGVRKYGKDYYHERALATRRAAVSPSEEDQRLEVAIVSLTNIEPQDPQAGPTDAPTAVSEDDKPEQPNPELDKPNPKLDEKPDAPTPSPSDPIPTTDQEETPEDLKRKNLAMNPLRWFGVLVPPDLRSSQKSFAAGVDNAVADAVNAARAMREIEVAIRKARKDIQKAERLGV